MEEFLPEESIVEQFALSCKSWEHDPSEKGAEELLSILTQNRTSLEQLSVENGVRFFNFNDVFDGSVNALTTWIQEDDPLQIDVARRCLSELLRFIG